MKKKYSTPSLRNEKLCEFDVLLSSSIEENRTKSFKTFRHFASFEEYDAFFSNNNNNN